MKQLEIACFNLESAIVAQQGGADRVELCDDQHLGGTTPNLETVQKAREALTIDLYIMIRPRGGNFCYNESELAQMKADILQIKTQHVEGFVFGVLDSNNRIDVKANAELVKLAHPLPCTFHRAFDETPNLVQAMDEILQCGFSTILTSGGKKNVDEGETTLANLVELAENKITIMPGGGLRSSNSKRMAENTKATFYHSSAVIDTSGIADIDEVKALKKTLE